MESNKQLVCPWWLGWVLVSPLRKLFQHPGMILSPYIKPDMKVVDFGCAMGYFTLPMARMVGDNGHVYGIDIQQKMIDWLLKRATKARLEDIISPVLITPNTDFQELNGKIDFVLLFAMVHEVPDRKELFSKVSAMVKPGAKILFAEPRGHVTQADFEESVDIAVSSGLKVIRDLTIKGSLAVLLSK